MSAAEELRTVEIGLKIVFDRPVEDRRNNLEQIMHNIGEAIIKHIENDGISPNDEDEEEGAITESFEISCPLVEYPIRFEFDPKAGWGLA